MLYTKGVRKILRIPATGFVYSLKTLAHMADEFQCQALEYNETIWIKDRDNNWIPTVFDLADFAVSSKEV